MSAEFQDAERKDQQIPSNKNTEPFDIEDLFTDFGKVKANGAELPAVFAKLGINEKGNIFQQTKDKDALLARQKPYAVELSSTRKALAAVDVEGKLGAEKRWDWTTVSANLENPGAQKITVSSTTRPDVLVARKGDKTFILNKEQPHLDTMITDSGQPAPAKINWEEGAREERKDQLLTATISLRQQAMQACHDKKIPIAEDFMKSYQSVLKIGNSEGVFDNAFYAENLGSIGQLYIQELGNPNKGLTLQEQSLAILEKEGGMSNIKTMEARALLMRNYASHGRMADAQQFERKQREAMPAFDQSSDALSYWGVTLRNTLITQLEATGQKDEAEKIRDRAYKLATVGRSVTSDNGENIGLKNQRNSLLDHYVSNNQLDKVKTLINDQIKDLRKEDRIRPALRESVAEERDKIINILDKLGDKDKLIEVLDDKLVSLNTGITSQNGREQSKLDYERLELAKQYLKVGGTSKALSIAKDLIQSMEKRHSSPETDAYKRIQDRISLASSLSDLSQTSEMQKFQQETIQKYNAYEKSDEGKRYNGAALASIRRTLIEHLMESKNYKDAEPLLESELKYLARKDNDEKFRIGDTRGKYIKALLANGRYEKAMEVLQPIF